MFKLYSCAMCSDFELEELRKLLDDSYSTTKDADVGTLMIELE